MTALEELLAEKAKREVLALEEQRLVDKIKRRLLRSYTVTASRRHVVRLRDVVSAVGQVGPRNDFDDRAYALVRRAVEEMGCVIVNRSNRRLVRGIKVAGATDEEATSTSRALRESFDPWERSRDLTKHPKNTTSRKKSP